MIKLFTKKELYSLKYILAFLLIIYGIFVYSALVGYKLFDTSTEKWQADGPGNHNHSNRSHIRSNGNYHK